MAETESEVDRGRCGEMAGRKHRTAFNFRKILKVKKIFNVKLAKMAGRKISNLALRYSLRPK
jgi:hypothetical protein